MMKYYVKFSYTHLRNIVNSAEAAVLVVVEDLVLGNEADGRHVGRADRLDFVDRSKSILTDQLKKIIQNFLSMIRDF